MSANKKKIAKKVIIVHVLHVLYKYTSFEHTATQTAIARYLNDMDIPCDRKTVGRNINYLMDAGLPIHKKNGGYFYDENDTFFVKETKYN